MRCSPTPASVMVTGKDVAGSAVVEGAALRRSIGCVFQDFRLLPNRTAYENVAFALEVIGKTAATASRRRCRRCWSWSASAARSTGYPHELSGGEQQRVAMARAFVNRPLILLADEPTGNLDPTTCVEIMRLLDRINRTGTTVVMVTHDDEIVDQMRKRVVEIDGRPHGPRPVPRCVRLHPLTARPTTPTPEPPRCVCSSSSARSPSACAATSR